MKLEADSAVLADPSLQDNKVINPEKNSNPNPRLNVSSPSISSGDGGGQALKPVSPIKNPVKPNSKPAVSNQKITKPVVKENIPKPEVKKKEPKAVMPKKAVGDENGGYN